MAVFGLPLILTSSAKGFDHDKRHRRIGICKT
jgi:hypothetical protein